MALSHTIHTRPCSHLILSKSEPQHTKRQAHIWDPANASHESVLYADHNFEDNFNMAIQLKISTVWKLQTAINTSPLLAFVTLTTYIMHAQSGGWVGVLHGPQHVRVIHISVS